jgi:cytochrome c556
VRSLRIMRSVGVCVIAAAGLLATVALAQAPAAPQPAFQAVGTMRQLMIDIIYPTSDAIFYVDREPPKSQHDWDLLRTQALTMAESGNLLMMEGRARDQKNWIMESKMLVDIGGKAYKAAQAKDIDGIRALNDSLNAACVVCHYQYRPGYHRRKPVIEVK